MSPYDGTGITCVVVSYRSGEVLPAFLDSMRVAAPNIPITVVNNDGGDHEPSDIVPRYVGVTLVESDRNRGYGGGMNLGVAASAPNDWILIANPDIEVTPDVLSELLAAAAAGHPTAGILGPRLLNPDGTTYPSARSLPGLRTGVGHALFSSRFPDNPWTQRYHAFRKLSMDAPSAVGWLSGAFLLVRADVFSALGGFDEGFMMYFEDTDLGRRAGAAGFENLYVPTAVVTHLGGHSTAGRRPEMVMAHHRSAYRYLALTHPQGWLAPLRAFLWASLEVRGRLTSRRRSAPEAASRPT